MCDGHRSLTLSKITLFSLLIFTEAPSGRSLATKTFSFVVQIYYFSRLPALINSCL